MYTTGKQSFTTPCAPVGADNAQLFPVLEELKNELVPVNTWRVLCGGSSNRRGPGGLDNSAAKVKHRNAEQERRVAIKGLQEQMSAFFLVRWGKISVGDLLLFGKLITRLRV